MVIVDFGLYSIIITEKYRPRYGWGGRGKELRQCLCVMAVTEQSHQGSKHEWLEKIKRVMSNVNEVE